MDSSHSGLGIFTAVCLLMPGTNICPCYMWKRGWEMSMNRTACRKEFVQINERSPQSILEKQKGNTWTCVVPYCSSLRTLHLLPISPPLFGRRDTKAEHTLAKACFSFNTWVMFSAFSIARAATVPSDICVLQAQGCSVTHS